MDLWMVLLLTSFAASELLRENSPKDGFIFFADTFAQFSAAYSIGRWGIQPNLRLPALKRIVLILVCLAPAILYEYRMGANPWITYGQRVFSISAGAFVQLRGGHARVQGCFGHAIHAGIFFFTAFLLSQTLTYIYKRDTTRLGPGLSKLERYHLPGLLLIIFLYLTGSRGPLISGILGFFILQIPRFRSLKVGAAVVLLFLAIGGSAVYLYFDKYTEATDTANMTEAQTSAIYRRDMLKQYEPLVEAGGWLGWGALSAPRLQGMDSIDNTYLLTQLSYGKLGLYLFLLIAAESIFTAAQFAFTCRSGEDRVFAFGMLGSLLGIFVSLYSVFLGGSLTLWCFFLLGWGQSLQDSSVSSPGVTGEAPEPKYRFKKVFA